MEKEIFSQLPEKTKSFITELTKNGIPLDSIDVNDFNCNTKPSIYITIPYGQNNGGKVKRISNNYLNQRSINSALKFYNVINDNIPRSIAFAIANRFYGSDYPLQRSQFDNAAKELGY